MLAKYVFPALLWSGCTLGMIAFASGSCRASQPPWHEADLLSILGSDAPDADKALACKQLAVCGSAAATPPLGQLLNSPHLSSWARIALEAIPDASAEHELVRALDRVTGHELIGVINSLAARESRSACDQLAQLVRSSESAVSTAAILALGKIGDPKSSSVLASALESDRLEIRDAAAEAIVCLAEALAAGEQSPKALRLCQAVRSSQASVRWKAAAARIEIIADHDHRVERLVDLIEASDAVMFKMGLMTAREVKDSVVTDALTTLLPELPAVKQTQALHVLRDRADQQALPAVLELLQSDAPEVQIATLGALAVLGDATCLQSMIELYESSAEPAVRTTAWNALRTIPGPDVDRALVKMAETAQGQRLCSMIELVGERGVSAVPMLQAATRSEEQATRHAAWLALGRTVAPGDLQLLIEAILAPAHPEDQDILAAGLRKAALRMPDSTITVRELANALPIAPNDTKTLLIQIIADVEGAEALAVVSAAARGDDPELKELASASLGKWRSREAAPILLEIAMTESARKYRVRALRGYLRIARQFELVPEERVRMCERALKAAERDEERALVLDVLRAHPSLELLDLIKDSSEREYLRQAAPAIIGVLLRDDPPRRAELLDRLQELGFEPSALPEA